MYTIEELKEIMRERLTKKRYIHSLNVADESRKLAKKWSVDQDTAYLAGLLHDICKDIPQKEQKDMVDKSSFSVDTVELFSPPLWHAIAGAWYAENILGITDKNIINAIRYHTVSRAGMSRLEEIIYIADLISIDRNYKDAERMRRLAYTNLDRTMLEAIKYSIIYVVNKGSKLPSSTIEAYNQYTLVKNK